jgi:hypothetical protein
MRRDVGKTLPADRLCEQARRAAALTIWSLDTDLLGEPTSKGGESFMRLGNTRIRSAHCRSQSPRASLPFKQQLADESITSLGKSVDDLPPLPCGLP